MRTIDLTKAGSKIKHAKAQTMQWNEFMDNKISEVESQRGQSQGRFRNTTKKPQRTSTNDYAVQEVFDRNTNNTVISKSFQPKIQ